MAVHNLGRYASLSVPRYTSYPPAPHFHGEIDRRSYRAWLRQVPPNEPLSLYFHVPYCRSICNYCGCFTKASRKQEPIDAYAAMLLAEILIVAGHLPGRVPVAHMHWGGGTPSLLSHDSFQKLLRTLSDTFDLSAVAEHAIELDPRLVDVRLADTLMSIGITRVSLGVQDVNPCVQNAIGRVQPLDVVGNAVSHLRSVGLDAINMDVMYGLPHQSLEDVVRTVTACATLGADRIALFGYAHVPWMKANQKLLDESSLPSAGIRLEQARAAHKALEHLGFVSVGFDHFARPADSMAKAVNQGTLHRNFQGYTTDGAATMVGFGASAIGRSEAGYVQNIADIARWSESISKGELATARGYALEPEDRLRGSIIEDLLTSFETDLARERNGTVPTQTWINSRLIALDDLAADGLCDLMGSVVRIPKDARFLTRLVAARFDMYLDGRATRHSSAV